MAIVPEASRPLVTLEQFIRGLPNGLDSYPSYTVKSSVFRAFIAPWKESPLPSNVPKPIRDLWSEPPPVNVWIPEAMATGAFCLIRDLFFDSDVAYVDHCYEANVALLSSPLYRAIAYVLSPATLMKTGASRWPAFHKGIVVRTQLTGDKQVNVRMEYPTGLLPPVIARSYATAFRAAAEAAGGKSVRFIARDNDASHIVFEGTWE